MRKLLCMLLCLCMTACMFVLPDVAAADRMYLIPDSDTRKLSYMELWQWDYESLGYILNEIFARHGYVFEPGGKYDYYFSSLPWYVPNSSSDNQRYCYPRLNATEWHNEQLVKDVRADMRSMHTTNRGGRSVWSGFSTGFDVLNGFDYVELKSGQKLEVFSAPSSSSWRGANGKAAISTNGAVYTAGWESGWLMVMYETNTGVRVGYVNGGKIKGNVPVDRYLMFQYSDADLVRSAALTDDPASRSTTILTLPAGSHVTYLTSFINHQAWDYVQTEVDGKAVRGFIPSGALDIGIDEYEDDSLGNG